MLTIKNSGSNYLARVIWLPAPRKHANADRLQCVSVLGNNVITGLDAKEGALYVYFPLECTINKDYLAWSNSFADSVLNRDTLKKGFFDKNGRVKAIKLRGEKSEGYIVPVKDINDWASSGSFFGKQVITVKDVDQDFDTIGGTLFCEKYVNQNAIDEAARLERANKIRGKKARESKIIEGQYHLAADTENLKRNINKIDPNDWITISYKMHGCNTSLGKVLCKKPLKWYEKLLKKIGINIVDTHYDLVWASRRVVKNAFADKQAAHYYDLDVWGLIADKYKDSIHEGITLHGEIVNQLPNGKWVQKDYDYGYSEGVPELYIYRIFYTNPKGKVFEFNTKQIEQYCLLNNLKVVPIFYDGPAKDLFPELNVNEHWHENFLAKLVAKYNEKDCYMCKSKVPEEGIVLTKNSKNVFESWKLKSFKFLERETKELDSGEANIEDVN